VARFNTREDLLHGLMQDILSVWRSAERLLEELPPRTPDRDRLSAQAARMRFLYQLLATKGTASEVRVRSAREMVRDSLRVISEARRPRGNRTMARAIIRPRSGRGVVSRGR
jgi:hypothetical protein